MKYNLSEFGQTISNTSEGDLSLTTDEVITITNTNLANIMVPPSGTLSGTLVLDCDLGSRIHIDDIIYYYDSPAPMSTVASGITFYYKKEEFEPYISLDTHYNASYYYTNVSGSVPPRYIRVKHVVASGIGGYLNGLEVLNDDTYVDFGEDGLDNDHNVVLSIENPLVEINELQVFNSGPIKANAKVFLEPQFTIADDVLSISDSSEGPWYGVRRDEDKIASAGSWNTGTHDDTRESGDILVLDGAKTLGTYTTRIIDIDDYQKLTFNIIEYTYPNVIPQTSFFDDFSKGNEQWTVEPINTYTLYFSNQITLIRASGDGLIAALRTTDVFDYSDDWNLTFKLFWNDFYTAGNEGLFIYFMWPVTNFYLNIRPSGGNRAMFYFNGVTYDAALLYDFGANENRWNNFRIQRSFNTLRWKIWRSSDSEPSSWNWSGTLTENDLPDFAGLRFRIENAQPGKYFYFDDFNLIRNFSAFGGGKSTIATDDIDTIENIEVKSSNSLPMDRETYIYMTGNYSAATKYTNHKWVVDGSSAEQSSDWSTWGRTSNFFEYWYDSKTEDEYIVDKPFYTAGTTGVYLRIRRKSGTIYSATMTNSSYGTACYWNTYKLVFDNSGGFWIYFYLSINGADGGNYYLRYYNSTMTLIYNKQTTAAQGSFLYDMDSVYNSSGHLWYTDNDLSTVFKIDSSGVILTSYLATTNIRGLFATDDGGCWFINGAVLVGLDSNGVLATEIELPSDTASYVYSDLDSGFWVHDGYIIRHLSSDGTEYFNVEIQDLYWITVMDSGVLTKQHNGSTTVKPQASYVSKYHKKVMRTWDYPRTEGGYTGTFDYSRYGVRSQAFDSDYASNFPIPIDTQWNSNAQWVKVDLRDYNFTNEKYHQLRLTLRADNSANSPQIYGIYTQRSIEVPNIYPNNYGKFYLKSDASSIDVQDVGNYTSKVRAYWFLDTE